MKLINQIFITNDYAGFKAKILSEFSPKNLRFFESDELKIDEARKIIDEAYIAEVENKIIVISAVKFRDEAQNALLKILEEPPRNTIFFLVAPSITLLLPTIRSRLMVQNLLGEKKRERTGLNLRKIDLRQIDAFINECINKERVGSLDKFTLKSLVMQLVIECFEAGIKFSASELEHINKLVYLVEHNAKSHAVLPPLFLIIKGK